MLSHSESDVYVQHMSSLDSVTMVTEAESATAILEKLLQVQRWYAAS